MNKILRSIDESPIYYATKHLFKLKIENLSLFNFAEPIEVIILDDKYIEDFIIITKNRPKPPQLSWKNE